MCLSDVLVAHSYQLQMWDSSAGAPLLYTPEPRLQKALLNFILEHVFTGPEQHSHSNTGSPVLLLSSFCPLYLTIRIYLTRHRVYLNQLPSSVGRESVYDVHEFRHW